MIPIPNPKTQIINSLQKVVGKIEINLEIPEREEFGDYATNIALVMFGNDQFPISNLQENLKSKILNLKSPHELAETIVSLLKSDKELTKIVDKIQVAGPGFINFHLNNDVLLNNMMQIDGSKSAANHPLGEIHSESKNKDFSRRVDGHKFGSTDLYKDKKFVIEFAHPNTHKAFHIGHLRNISTGESICRILSYCGAEIIRVNYQGDVGLHIAKALWGINKLGFSDPESVQERADFLGKAYVEGNKAYEENEVSKEEIHKINEELYKRTDTALMDLYKKTRQWSLDYFDYLYKRVGTKFDRLYFESEVAEEGTKLAGEALGKNILEKSEGAVIFPGSKYNLHDRVFITSRGVPTYEGKDLGLAKLQFSEHDPDQLIHIVGPEQTEYFKVLFKALEYILPITKGKEVHIPYGWVRLKKGKMSSRSGNVVLGNWLLDEAKKNIIEKYKSGPVVAEQIAVGAVKYSFLKNSLTQEIAFDLDESISFEGNSGPYLQYTYARTRSVLAKSKIKNQKSKNKRKIENRKWKIEEEEFSVMKALFHFPEIVESAAQNYAPNFICNYLYELAQKFNSFYSKHKILVDDPLVLEFRVRLASATGTVLKSGLNLLGIDSPERM